MKKSVTLSNGWTIRLGLLVALLGSVTLGACSKDKKLIAACEKANGMTGYMKQHPTPEGACKTCLESMTNPPVDGSRAPMDTAIVRATEDEAPLVPATSDHSLV